MSKAWLLLVTSLPTHNATGRMRLWRALKALGCAALRDGVYLLPQRSEFRPAIQAQADEVVASGGSAHLLVLDSESEAQQQFFESLFDRSDDYAQLVENIRQAAGQDLQTEEPAKLQRRVNRLRKAFAAVAALDFFPGPSRARAALALEELEQAVIERLAPGEPHAAQGQITRLRFEDFQGRLWATRKRPWIDRLASAWLIGRFIDPKARFLWLDAPSDCPPEALGFDFDGAAFTHIGAKVTFETLLAGFGLTDDAALKRLGDLVHYLDVGGIPVLEAAGLETLCQGMRRRLADDDALLAEACKVFDSFYTAFSGNEP